MQLHSLVTDVLNTSGLTDPKELSTVVVSQIDEDDLRATLQVVLPGYIRRVAAERRSDHGKQPVVPARAVSNTGLSVKSAQYRDYKAKLQDTIVVDGEWKTLAECTSADFSWLTEWHEDVARKNLDKAETYRVYAKEMANADAATFDDLDVKTKRRLLDDQ